MRLLHTEAKTVTLQVRLLSDGKVLRRTRAKYVARNARLEELWQQYVTGCVLACSGFELIMSGKRLVRETSCRGNVQ